MPLLIAYIVAMNIGYCLLWLLLILLKKRYSIDLYNYSFFFFECFTMISIMINIFFAVDIVCM